MINNEIYFFTKTVEKLFSFASDEFKGIISSLLGDKKETFYRSCGEAKRFLPPFYLYIKKERERGLQV